MPKNETGKNTKGTKKTTTKSNVSKKTTSTKKATTKPAAKKSTTTKKTTTKVEVKKEPAKVVEKETIKPVVNEKITERKNTNESSVNGLMNNTPFVIALCVIVILIAILIFAICSKRVPKTSNGDEIIASLKGKDITANELYEALKEEGGTNSLINLVDTYIANKEVTIKDEDKEYAKEVVNYYKQYAEYYGVDLITFVTSYMGLSDIASEDDFYDFVLEDYKKTLAVKKYVKNQATEEELKEYYEKNFSDKLTVRHILVEVDKDTEDQDAADREAYDKAVSLINQLNETSAEELNSKFEDLAKNNSDDTQTYSNGGLMENIEKAGIQESFFNAANELKDGEYTKEPVKTTYGYHVILKISSTPVEKYEDIKDTVKDSYADNLLSNTTLKNIKWDELRNQYKMSIKDDIIKEAYSKIINEQKDAYNKTEEN